MEHAVADAGHHRAGRQHPVTGAGRVTKRRQAQQAQAHATKQGYQFAGPVVVSVAESSNLGIGQVYVTASSPNIVASDVQWSPRLEVVTDGLVFELQKSRPSVGRDSSADVQIHDTGLSRKHFEIICILFSTEG